MKRKRERKIDREKEGIIEVKREEKGKVVYRGRGRGRGKRRETKRERQRKGEGVG